MTNVEDSGRQKKEEVSNTPAFQREQDKLHPLSGSEKVLVQDWFKTIRTIKSVSTHSWKGSIKQ